MSYSSVILWAEAVAKVEEATNKSKVLRVILVFAYILLWCSDEGLVDWTLRFESVDHYVILSSKTELGVHTSPSKVWFSMRLRQTIIWSIKWGKCIPSPGPSGNYTLACQWKCWQPEAHGFVLVPANGKWIVLYRTQSWTQHQWQAHVKTSAGTHHCREMEVKG